MEDFFLCKVTTRLGKNHINFLFLVIFAHYFFANYFLQNQTIFLFRYIFVTCFCIDNLIIVVYYTLYRSELMSI